MGDRLGYVHIGENQRGYLGSGPITFELLLGGRQPGHPNDLKIRRNMWSDGLDLASSARSFIETLLVASAA